VYPSALIVIDAPVGTTRLPLLLSARVAPFDVAPMVAVMPEEEISNELFFRTSEADTSSPLTVAPVCPGPAIGAFGAAIVVVVVGAVEVEVAAAVVVVVVALC
jgi:hypothetical protein